MPEAILVEVRKLFPDAEIAGADYWSGGKRCFRDRCGRWYSSRIYAHRLQSGFDCSHDVQERFIDVGPCLDCFAVLRYGLKLSEREIVPIAGTHNHWDHSRFSIPVPLHGPRHFEIVAIFRSDEIGADKQENQIGCVQMLIYLRRKFGSSGYTAIMP
jgi:hypothetical protein